jgi:hypothetical protein
MCDPITGILLAGATSLAGSLLAPKPAAPPPLPAAAPDAPRAAGATVRTGDGQTDDTTKTDPTTTVSTAETRVSGRPVGGLGMSGLSI